MRIQQAKISGSILDSGCGTGENALFFAKRGNTVTGIDFVDGPIQLAKRKADERHIKSDFYVKDAVELKSVADWAGRFDCVIDSGLFHVFPNKARAKYVQGLHFVLKPSGRLFLLCFSDETPGTEGPRRISRNELREAFADAWKIDSIQSTTFEVRPEAKKDRFSGEEPKGWFLIATRR